MMNDQQWTEATAKVLAEVDLREALYALNRALGKLQDAQEETREDIVKARDLVWAIGERRYEWEG